MRRARGFEPRRRKGRKHALIEDVPGLGKTVLAKTLARSLGVAFQRVQFTPDLLPSDITGVSVFSQKTGDFEFRPGPLMANIVLARDHRSKAPHPTRKTSPPEFGCSLAHLRFVG